METDVKKILFITGTRADFGKIKPLIEQVERSSEFEAYIFATGMHMLSRYGSTILEIQRAGFKNIFSYINQDSSVNTQMDLVVGNTIQGLGHYVREFPPDLIVVHGDRTEALAGSIVGSLTNTLVAHIEGGEVSGTIDELIRHSVTKLSHLHFVSNVDAKRRLVQMGESPDSVFVIGSPDIDVMLSDKLPTLSDSLAHYEIPFSDYGIFVLHPVTTELSLIKTQTNAVVDAVEESGMNFIAIYPNNDHGADIIYDAFTRFENNPRIKVFPSMRFEYFLTFLKNTKVIVGNSSSGIREAPVYGVPTINIGTRQLNRFNYPSILNVPSEKAAILKALKNLPDKIVPTTHFGTGDSAKHFMELLRNPDLWNIASQKHFRDLEVEKGVKGLPQNSSGSVVNGGHEELLKDHNIH